MRHTWGPGTGGCQSWKGDKFFSWEALHMCILYPPFRGTPNRDRFEQEPRWDLLDPVEESAFCLDPDGGG